MAKQLEGIVISTKMNKTITVEVERAFRHPLYKKIIRRNKKYKVRNDDGSITVGDMVRIEETRPLSKEVHFRLINKLSK